MKPIHLAGILFILLVSFLVWEIIFSTQRYGLPKFDIFKAHPGSCKILEEQFCNKLKIQIVKNSQGQEFTLIVGNLPAGTPIYAPFDGQVSTGKINRPLPSQGYSLNMNNHGVNYNFQGDFKPLKTLAKTGDIIATMTNTGAKILDKSYNFAFNAQRPNKTKTDLVTAEDIERQLFPKAK